MLTPPKERLTMLPALTARKRRAAERHRQLAETFDRQADELEAEMERLQQLAS